LTDLSLSCPKKQRAFVLGIIGEEVVSSNTGIRELKRALVISAIVSLSLLVLVNIVGFWIAPELRVGLSEILSERTGRPVQIKSFGWSLWPALQFKGEGLSIGSAEVSDAIYVFVEDLRVGVGIFGLLSSPRSIDSVNLNKVLIRIPPGRNLTQSKLIPARIEKNSAVLASSPVVVEKLVLKTAAIELLSRDPEKAPRIIELRTFVMKDVALGQASPFEADLINPRPTGNILVSGQVGPFDRDEPIRTPISGHYRFTNADLGEFRDIQGILGSEGEFKGDLGENHVEGTAQIPDFQLAKVGNVVPLDVTYVVERIGGEVYLRDVKTSFLETRLSTTGEVRRQPGRSGRVVDLHVVSEEARVEDLLRIALKGDEPPLVGEIGLDTKVTIPPGEGRTMERMVIEGLFQIEHGEFTNPDFQKKLAQISKIGRREQAGQTDDRAFSDLNGEFQLENAVIRFSRLEFGVPGMLVSLTGDYGLESQEMDFRGHVDLERSVSEMTKGRLSDWLRILDPVLKRGNAGTSVPIRIKGTRSSPSVSLGF
jgi:hypothetical protein